MPAIRGNDYAKGNDGGAPSGNNNAEKHGMSGDCWNWFRNHREEAEDSVRESVANMVSKLDVTWDDTAEIKMLTEIAIQQEQMKQGNEYIEDEGFITEEVVVSGDDVVTRDVENPALKAKSRLFRDTLRGLNKFGLLDSPEAQQADAEQDKVQAWKEALTGGETHSHDNGT